MKTKVDKFHAELRVEGEGRMRAANDATNAATAGQRKSSGKALTLVPKVSVKLSTPLRSVNTSMTNQAGPPGGAPRARAKGWVAWKENGKIVFAERQGAPSSLEVGESDDEDCEITAVTHVSDPVASLDLCQVCG